ncbi:GNAT family N-acetyltransferase [Colwellia asteriadis]|uniref:GNAT family N-acetyltransferase n=1 Tax=Colwellia asteriadis TaxID=517723 RepID=A0ABP3WM71_9GAMM
MIREYKETDIESLLDIWLSASKIAHDFIEPTFWDSQVENMRNIYIPASNAFVYEKNSKVVGFYALFKGALSAIFVKPSFQRQGIGKQLLNHAKNQSDTLKLSVYKENTSSYYFYLSQGFVVDCEQIDTHTGHLEYTMSVGT